MNFSTKTDASPKALPASPVVSAQRFGEFLGLLIDDAHALATAARRGLEQHRVPDRLRHFCRGACVRHRTVVPGTVGTPLSSSAARARSLLPIARIVAGGGR